MENEITDELAIEQALRQIDRTIGRTGLRVTDLKAEELGEIGYNDRGEKVQLWDDAEPAEGFLILRRSDDDIRHSIDEFFSKIWYYRHVKKLQNIEAGLEPAMSEDYRNSTERSIRVIEQRHGKQNLGALSDFEWGTINGKLWALQWVMGDEWDIPFPMELFELGCGNTPRDPGREQYTGGASK